MQLLLTTLPPDPIIYPSFLHSIDHEITTRYSANIKIFWRGGGFAQSPHIYPSFLHSLDTEITNHYIANLY